MERLKERLKITEKALDSFEEILKMEFSKVVRDAALQRFKFTLEALLKLAQRYLFLKEGLDIGSPKGVFRGCFQVGLVNEDQTNLLLEAVSDRNLTVHTYDENLANQIYNNLKYYLPIFQILYSMIQVKDR